MSQVPEPVAGVELLPLRVAGVNYHYEKNMARLMKAAASVSAPLWTHFPDICAEPACEARSESDYVLSPGYLMLDVPATTDGGGASSAQRRRAGLNQGHGLSQDSSDLEHKLKNYFELASAKNGATGYLTPFQLLLAVLDTAREAEGLDGCGQEFFTFKRTGDYLSMDLRDAPAKLRDEIKVILYMLRELSYQSQISKTKKPRYGISLTGRIAAEIASPIPYTKTDPPIDLGPSTTDALRYVSLHEPMHVMALGASGTGKTHSVVVPRLKGHLAYKLADGTKGAALIVDPKKELGDITERFLASMGEHDRLFMAGRHGRLQLFPKTSTLSLHDRVALVLEALDVSAKNRGESGTWVQKSLALLMGLVDAHAITFNKTGRNLFIDLMEAAGRDSSYEKGYWFALRDVIRLLQEGIESARWLHQRLMAQSDAMGLQSSQRAVLQFLARYVSMEDDGANQLSYVTGGLEGALTSLCDEALSNWLDLSPVPEMHSESNDDLFEIEGLIDASRVIVFQPNDTPSSDIATRLLKAQFYRAAMGRRNLRQPVLFLCDEFQRFVTSDRESGEASLLDRCRAYRITVVLASQSVTALYDALAKRDDQGNPAYAVDSILGNIAYMFHFQTFDHATTIALRRALPSAVPGGWVHPLDILPLSAMRVGEAYFLAPQGRWGRTHFSFSKVV